MQLPDPEQFQFKDCVIGGDECLLIVPSDMSTVWTNENSRFRSCIIRKSDHHVISQGFRKFVDYGVSPEFEPWNPSWEARGFHKIDGSLLLISKYKGELIIRTRNTISARQMPNGHEIDFLIEKYPLVFDNEHLNKENITILTEWSTPSNTIVYQEYDEPTLTLLNIVNNETAEYEDQYYLNYLAKKWNIGRPQEFRYSDLLTCIKEIESWQGKEGIVLYSPDFQILKRVKSEQYRYLHRICTGTRSISSVLDMFMDSPRFTNYPDFYEYVSNTYYVVLAEKVKDDMKMIAEAYDKFLHTVDDIKKYIDKHVRFLETRKEQAIEIQTRWGEWSGLAFNFLDNKEVDDKLVKKSLEKILKI